MPISVTGSVSVDVGGAVGAVGGAVSGAVGAVGGAVSSAVGGAMGAVGAALGALGLGQSDLLLGFRFGVFFFALGVVPNPIDIRFQRVRGLTATVRTRAIAEGGQNLYVQQVPEVIEYGNLVLERGMVIGSPLNIEFNAALTLFKFAPSNVLVTLFNDGGLPVSAWMFMRAFPVKWSTSDLDATQKNLLIDTLELSYSRMQIMRI